MPAFESVSALAAPVPSLPLDLVLRACSLLPPNEIACTARLLCKASTKHFSAPHHRTVRLSQPVPPHAFAARYGRGADPGPLKQLTWKQKELLFALTASGGVIGNVAALVERMEPPFWWRVPNKPLGDACVAAARAGHMHVVRWLLQRGYPLDTEASTGMAAAVPDHKNTELLVAAVMQHCDLDDVRWLLQRAACDMGQLAIVEAAARSALPNAIAKLKFILSSVRRRRGALLPRAAEAAAAADNLEGLQWALGQAGPVSADLRQALLSAAARLNATRVTAWLLEQGGGVGVREAALAAAEQGQAGALRLLLPRALEGRPGQWDQQELLKMAFMYSALSGSLEAMQLVSELAAAHGHAQAVVVNPGWVTTALLCGEVACKGLEAARWVLQQLGEPVELPSCLLRFAVRACSLDMLAFLCDEARTPWPDGPQDVLLDDSVRSSAKGDDLIACLQWLHDRGRPLAFSEADTGAEDAASRD